MIEVVLNDLSQEGMRRIKVISDKNVSEAWLRRWVPGAVRGCEQVKCYGTAALNLFYGEVTWPCREFYAFQVSSSHVRRLLTWKFVAEEGYRLSEIIEYLSEQFFVKVHRRPGFAFVRKMPNTVESGEWEVDGVMLFEAEWVPMGCVCVGG